MTTVTVNVRDEPNYELLYGPNFGRRPQKGWETSISMIVEASMTLLVALVGLISWLPVFVVFIVLLVLLLWVGVQLGLQVRRWRWK